MKKPRLIWAKRLLVAFVSALLVATPAIWAESVNDWSSINDAVNAKKAWLSLEVVTSNPKAATVVFGRLGSQVYCEIQIKGRSPVRRNAQSLLEAFKLAVMVAYPTTKLP